VNTLTPLNVVTTSISAGATVPTAPTGALVYSSAAAALLQFNGTSWQALAGSGGGSSTLAGDGDVAISSPVSGNLLSYNGSKWANAAPSFADLTSAQTIAGIKTFSSPPVFSGASMTAGTLAPAALSTAAVLVSGAQTVAGVKTFSSAPVMSGASITNATIPNAALTQALAATSLALTDISLDVTLGQISLNNATSNMILYGTAGSGPPVFGSTRSGGTRLVIYPYLSSTTSDFAIGYNGGSLWSSVPNNGSQFQWYAGTTVVATLSGSGNLSVTGSAQALYVSASTYNGSAPQASCSIGYSSNGPIVYGGTTSQVLQLLTSNCAQYMPVNGGTYSPQSDAKLKDNIEDIHYGLADVLKLQPRRFSWIATGKPDIGFIAQEMQPNIPEIVTASELPGTPDEQILGINYSGIIPIIVRAIQELSAQFTAYVAAHP
jgi:hypothetical protein